MQKQERYLLIGFKKFYRKIILQKYKILENGYTEGEMKMFWGLRMEGYIPQFNNPEGVYLKCVEQCFIMDLRGPAVEALRRTYKALEENGPKRHTNEFEDLVKF